LSISSEIWQQWYEGDLDCSFHSDLFLKLEISQLTLSHIRPHGRKVISNVLPFYGDPFAIVKEGFLEDNFLPEVEVFPALQTDYPLDMPRKFNAVEVIITNPIISEIREIEGKRTGKLNAKIYFRIKRITESVAIIEEKKKVLKAKRVEQQIETTIPKSSYRYRVSNLTSRFNFWGSIGWFFSFLFTSLNIMQFLFGSFISILLIAGIIGFFTKGCDDKRISSDKVENSENEDVRKLKAWQVSTTDKELTLVHVPVIKWNKKNESFDDQSKRNISIIGTYLLDNPSIKYKFQLTEKDENKRNDAIKEIDSFFQTVGIDSMRKIKGNVYELVPNSLASDILIVQFVNKQR
jgi:hypothetical protein